MGLVGPQGAGGTRNCSGELPVGLHSLTQVIRAGAWQSTRCGLEPSLTYVGVPRHLAQDVHLLQRGLSQLLHLLGAEAAPAGDVNDLHGILLACGLVDTAPDDTADSPGRCRGQIVPGSLTPGCVPSPGPSRDVLLCPPTPCEL